MKNCLRGMKFFLLSSFFVTFFLNACIAVGNCDPFAPRVIPNDWTILPEAVVGIPYIADLNVVGKGGYSKNEFDAAYIEGKARSGFFIEGSYIKGTSFNAENVLVRVYRTVKNPEHTYSTQKEFLGMIRVLPANVLPKIVSIGSVPLQPFEIGKSYNLLMVIELSGAVPVKMSVNPSEIAGLKLRVLGDSVNIFGIPSEVGHFNFSITAGNKYTPKYVLPYTKHVALEIK